MSSFHNSHASEAQSPKGKPKLTEEQKFHLIEQFFAKKLKFPTLNNQIIDEAISQDFLPFDDKEKILRDPNKLSIFFLKLDPQSPRTKEALEQLELSEGACSIFTFQQFQMTELHPICNLINYMNYLSEKYKELLLIVSTRNFIKKQQRNRLKLNKSHTQQQNNSTFITDGIQNSIVLPTNTKLSTIMSRSFNTRSLEFLQNSFDDKLELQVKRSQDYIKTLTRHKEIDELKLKSLHDYYEQKIPIRASKIEAAKLENKKIQQEKKKHFIERQKKTLEKIKQLEIEDREQRIKIQEYLNNKQQQSIQNKNQQDSVHNQQLKELQEKQQKKEEQRKEKKKLAQNLEEQQIEFIIEKQLEKEQQTEQLMQKLKDEIQMRKLQSIQKQEIAQQKVYKTQQEFQQNKLEKYIKLVNENNENVEKQINAKNLHLGEIKLKQENQFKSVQKNKQKLGKIFEQKIDEIKYKDTEKNVTGRLKSIQSSIDLKVKEQAQKNKIRQLRALNNTKTFAEEREKEQQKLIDKITQENQKQKQFKKKKEQYNLAILKQHLLERQSVDKIV